MATLLRFPEDVAHSDPERLGGTPVFVGTRVPIRSLFDHLEAGDSLEDGEPQLEAEFVGTQTVRVA